MYPVLVCKGSWTLALVPIWLGGWLDDSEFWPKLLVSMQCCESVGMDDVLVGACPVYWCFGILSLACSRLLS